MPAHTSAGTGPESLLQCFKHRGASGEHRGSAPSAAADFPLHCQGFFLISLPAFSSTVLSTHQRIRLLPHPPPSNGFPWLLPTLVTIPLAPPFSSFWHFQAGVSLFAPVTLCYWWNIPPSFVLRRCDIQELLHYTKTNRETPSS